MKTAIGDHMRETLAGNPVAYAKKVFVRKEVFIFEVREREGRAAP